MKKYLIVNFYGYHENGHATDKIWDIVCFEDEEISMELLNKKISHHFSSYRKEKQIVFITIRAI